MMSRFLVLSACCQLLCISNDCRAVEAEGVNEDHTIHALKPAERSSGTAPLDSPGAAEKGFRRAKFPPGFQASLWAGEPLLANPVAFSFDGKGRMYVAETHRYRTSVLDIRHYMFMLEDDLANRNQTDWERSIKRNFPTDWQKLGVESEVVRLVEDSDGDGRADKSSVYADGFNSILDGIASGVLARPDGVWLANIPGLYKLSGTGPAGKFTKKEELFRGFGVRFNYTGHDLHGLIKGPDGRIYFSIGDRGASVKTKEGGTIDVPDEGAIFRCEEDGSHLELVMRGLRNPQELAFDDYGNLFTCDNDSDQGDRERFVYVVEGGDAGWRVGYQHCPQPSARNPWLAEHMWEPREPGKNQPSYILSPLANLPDGPGGFVHYPGTGLPDKYKGCFFLACYKGSSLTSQVAVLKPVPDGASFKLEMLETFIPGCQATDVDFGPDSRLYVSFWDEGWERTAQGRILKVEHAEARKAQAGQIAEVQKLLAEGMTQRGVEDLVKLLGYNDQRVRLEAQWELAGRYSKASEGEKAKIESPVLEVLRTGRNQLQLIHAIWTFGQAFRTGTSGLKGAGDTYLLGAPTEGRELFNHSNPEVQAAYIRCFADQRVPVDHELSRLFHEKLRASSPRVRLVAVQAVGKHGSVEDIPALIEVLRQNNNQDQYLRHAAVVALATIGQQLPARAKLVEAAKHEDPAVRLGVMLALDRLLTWNRTALSGLDAAGLVQAAVAEGTYRGRPDFTDWSALEDAFSLAASTPDPAIIAEGLRLANHSEVPALTHSAAEALLGPWLGRLNLIPSDKVLPNDTMSRLRAMNGAFRLGREQDAVMLAGEALAKDTPDELKVEALTMLGLWPNPPARDRVHGLYRPLAPRNRSHAVNALLPGVSRLLEAPSAVAIACLHAIAALGDPSFAPAVADAATASARDAKVRALALNTLAKLESPLLQPALQKAISDPAAPVRIAAAGLLGRTDPALAVKGLTAALTNGTPADLRAAFAELKALHSPEADALIAGQVKTLTDGKVPAAAKLELLEAAAKREAPAAKEALAKYEASLPKDDVMAKFAACLEGGDAVNGKRLFKEHAVAACQRCHMVDRAGGEAGPPLDGIASRKDRRYMLESILLPNAQIAETFRMIVCNMKDGTVKSGVLKSETPDAVTIELPGEAPETVKSADIASKDSVPSAMLPNMGDLLTKRELRDIVEYLATLK